MVPPWVECSRSYGWRVQELLSMRVSQVDVAQRIIPLEPGTSKNREGREVAIRSTAFELLSALVENKLAGDYVFTRNAYWRLENPQRLWRYNIIDRREMANARRQLEEHKKAVGECRNAYSGYSTPSEVQTVPSDKVQ